MNIKVTDETPQTFRIINNFKYLGKRDITNTLLLEVILYKKINQETLKNCSNIKELVTLLVMHLKDSLNGKILQGSITISISPKFVDFLNSSIDDRYIKITINKKNLTKIYNKRREEI